MNDEYDDDDLNDDDDQDDDGDDDAAAAAAAAEAEAKAAADAKTKADAKAAKKAAAAAAKPEDTGPSETQLAELGLNALKQSFVESAKAEGYVTADFDGIGLKGIDEAAKAAFVAEAKESHETKVAALAAQGFVYNPEAAGAGKVDEQDKQQQQAWGATGPGQVASGDEKFTAQVEDEVKSGDVMGVIGSLVGQGGLGSFFVRGRKS